MLITVLVGRPNVGKSALFNCLTKTRNALVGDLPGLTRDRQYGEIHYQDKSCIVIDTGGLEDQHHLISKQILQGIEEANYILFVVDGKAGLCVDDNKIAEILRKANKPVILVINKMDSQAANSISSDLLSLGFKQIVYTSASHMRGIESLLESLFSNIKVSSTSQAKQEGIKIACIGRPNVGKSTLINKFLGEERVVVLDLPGTTRDSIYIPFIYQKQNYTLIDTAGVRKRSRIHEKIEKYSIIKTLQAIKMANLCLLLLDAKEGITDQDLHLLGLIITAGKALIIIMNKWDLVSKEERIFISSNLPQRLKFASFARIKYISALHGQGVHEIFKDIEEAYQSATQNLSTPKLTRILQKLVKDCEPPAIQGKRIKLRYAHPGGSNPPLIIIHGNQINALPLNYKKYLVNGFRAELKMQGTPLEINFRGSINPYEGKKNILTERQIKKRKRIRQK